MYCDISRALPVSLSQTPCSFLCILSCFMSTKWMDGAKPFLTAPPTFLWRMVPGKCDLNDIVNICLKWRKKNSLCWSSRVAFANVTLAMEPFGRGKEKTNRQVVPIMVFTRHWWASNYRIRACSCTQLWVLLSKFGETENGVQTEARACLCIKAAEPLHVIQCVRWPKNCWGWHLRVLSLLVYYRLQPLHCFSSKR